MRTVRLAMVLAGYAATAYGLWQRHGDKVRRVLKDDETPERLTSR